MNKDVLQAKQVTVSEIVAKAKDSSGLVVAEYRGLTVAELQQLRRALRAEGASMNVYKNSLVERASDELGPSAAGCGQCCVLRRHSPGSPAPAPSRQGQTAPSKSPQCPYSRPR